MARRVPWTPLVALLVLGLAALVAASPSAPAFAAPPPDISSLAPTSGPTAGGTQVVIAGSGFSGATSVTFDVTAAVGFSVDSNNQITATAPAHAAGTVDVVVTTPDGPSANTAADDYTYLDAGVTIVEAGGATAVTEGGATDSYTVVLNAQPTATVTVTLTPGSQVSVTAPGNQLSFTTGNWNSAQTVTVTAVDDAIVEGAHGATITHTASGGGYTGVSIADVSVTITDNDTAGVTVTESGGATAVTEGGTTDTYTLVLNLQPSENVVITITPGTQVTVNAPSNQLTFTTANWNTPQAVLVTAVDDA